MSPTDSSDRSLNGHPAKVHLATLEDLLQLVAQGQTEPFVQVYDRTSARVYGVATAILRDISSAEDVTRRVFCDVWELASCFDRASGSAVDWMMMLTRARLIERLRERRSIERDEVVESAGIPQRPTDGRFTAVVRQGAEYLTSLRYGVPLSKIAANH